MDRHDQIGARQKPASPTQALVCAFEPEIPFTQNRANDAGRHAHKRKRSNRHDHTEHLCEKAQPREPLTRCGQLLAPAALHCGACGAVLSQLVWVKFFGFMKPFVLTSNFFPLLQVGRYLDPFIDGEVPASQYQQRSAGTLMERLRAAWASDPARSGAMPEFAV